MLLLKISLNLLNAWMIFKIPFDFLLSSPFVFFIIIMCVMSCFFTGRLFNYFNKVVVKIFDSPNLICYNFLTVKYQDILVIKMTFICWKRSGKIPKVIRDVVKAFLYDFSPKRYTFTQLFFIKFLVIKTWFCFDAVLPRWQNSTSFSCLWFGKFMSILKFLITMKLS